MRTARAASRARSALAAPAPLQLVQSAPLRGARFAERLRAIFAEPAPPIMVEPLKHRRILMPGVVGGEIQFALMSLLGEALRLRGAYVTMLCCDRMLPACSMRKADHVEAACDRWCHANLPGFLAATALPHRWYGEFVSEDDRRRCRDEAQRVAMADLPSLVWCDVPIGMHVLRSIESHFKVGRFDPSDARMSRAAPDFVAAAMLMCTVAERGIDSLRPDKIVMNDGQKVKWGVLRDVAALRDVPVEVIRGGPRAGTVSFERDRPGAPRRRMPQWDAWRTQPLDADQRAQLEQYMQRRATLPYEARSLCHWTRGDSAAATRAACGLPPAHVDGASRGGSTSSLVFGMFPNLSYDAGFSSSDPLFETAAEWVIETIRFFERRPEHHLVIKVNPNEWVRSALDPLEVTVLRALGSMPSNVHLLPPQTPVPAQDLLRVLDIALVYTSTVAVEAAWLGRPVLLVGGGRHRGTGITIDIDTRAAYFDLLERSCRDGESPPTPPADLAERYAYAMFFRDLLPVRLIDVMDGQISAIHPRSRRDLAPGANPVLDRICNGILHDGELSMERWA